MKIVGNCPDCGAPIYGDAVIRIGTNPAITYSCNCKGENLAWMKGDEAKSK